MLKQADMIIVGGKTYVLNGPPRQYGAAKKDFGTVEYQGPVQKAQLVIGLERGVDEGPCKDDPNVYSSREVISTILVLREVQLGHTKGVGATVWQARGTWHGGSEDSIIVDLVWDKNEGMEPTFNKFKENILQLTEALTHRHCQKKILVTIKDGEKEDLWTVTP